MNAADQAIGVVVATKIAAVVNLFKTQFPDAKADLKPWANDPTIRDLIDPDSIDIGFHLPGWSRQMQCRSVLVQIRFHNDPLLQSRRAIGIEAAGFTHLGEQWRLSTVQNWQFVGQVEPSALPQEKLKTFCRQVFELFNTFDNPS